MHICAYRITPYIVITRKLEEVNPVPNLSMSPISGRGKRKIPAIPLSFCHGNPLKMWRMFSFNKQHQKHQKTKSDHSPSRSYLLPSSTYHFQVHVQYQIVERTIKLQEAGNKGLLQRIPVMPVNPHVLQLLATYVLRREDLTRGSLISGGFHHVHVPFRSGMLMEWLDAKAF